ncbi:MAG TPA: hypothetical protein VKE24_15695 [Candidatus Acidoferrales bacterium]|nr:hypothetical protein [Candidatus Acidoferrales bacterium]
MKRLLLFSCLATLATGSVRAQHEHHEMMHKTAAGVQLEVTNDTASHVLLLRVGPLDLPAHSGHMAVAQAPQQFWVVPFDGWLVAYHPRLVDGAGKPEPGRLLHHVAFWNTRRSDFLCPNKQEHIFGSGGELNDWPRIPGYGYRVAKGDRIRINTMFHNPTDLSYPRTYLEMRIEYQLVTPGGTALKSIYPSWFDVMECGQSAYDLRPGMNVTSGEFTLRYSGTLLGVGGHLHDYGRHLILEDLTRTERVAELEAKLDAQGHLVSMPVVNLYGPSAKVGSGKQELGYRLNAGERVRITAAYDNPTGKVLPEGAMGIVVGYFAPDNDTQMAALRRRDK